MGIEINAKDGVDFGGAVDVFFAKMFTGVFELVFKTFLGFRRKFTSCSDVVHLEEESMETMEVGSGDRGVVFELGFEFARVMKDDVVGTQKIPCLV